MFFFDAATLPTVPCLLFGQTLKQVQSMKVGDGAKILGCLMGGLANSKNTIYTDFQVEAQPSFFWGQTGSWRLNEGSRFGLGNYS